MHPFNRVVTPASVQAKHLLDARSRLMHIDLHICATIIVSGAIVCKRLSLFSQINLKGWQFRVWSYLMKSDDNEIVIYRCRWCWLVCLWSSLLLSERRNEVFLINVKLMNVQFLKFVKKFNDLLEKKKMVFFR